jgi:hypothetical protein
MGIIEHVEGDFGFICSSIGYVMFETNLFKDQPLEDLKGSLVNLNY